MQTNLLNKKCSYKKTVPLGSTMPHKTVIEGIGIIVACNINARDEFQFLIKNDKNQLISMSHDYITIIEE